MAPEKERDRTYHGQPNQQTRAVAEAFHNVPLLMPTDEFSFGAFREFLGRYQQAYQGTLRFNYLDEWEKLNASPATP